MRRLFVAVVVMLASALVATADASAYCRTTTCDSPDESICRKNDAGCVRDGVPAHWKDNVVPYRFAKGTPDTVRRAFENAAVTWRSAECEATDLARAGRTSLRFVHEDDEREEDADFVISVEDGIKEGAELGVTTLDFGGSTGTVKTARMRIDRSALDGDYDLEIILLHEIGHYLGLAHSRNRGSVMQELYESIPKTKSLADGEDVKAVCVLFPPEPLTQLPPSCNAGAPDFDAEPTGPALVVAGWLGVTVARRRRRLRLPAAR